MTFDERRLVFVIGPPRAGTTLLSRLLHAHPSIHAGPEPHLLTPLAHLGYFATVQKAPYDPIQTTRGQRAFVASLPEGERDYVDALRAFTDTLYGRLADARRADRVVDKTPAYALVLPFLARLYPEAHYVVITRHPFAVWASYARTFFDDDWGVAHAHNPLLERYVPAIGAFLRERPVRALHHLTYEALVAEPEPALRDLYAALDVPFDPATIEYGRAPRPPPGLGDPARADREVRPVEGAVHAWASAVADRPERRAALARMARLLTDEDLDAWGTPRAALWAPLAHPRGPFGPPRLDRHRLERWALVALRRNIHHNALGRALRAARFAIDVLLRE